MINMIIILSSLTMAVILITMNLLIMFKMNKMIKTPFECGFSSSFKNLTLPFSIQFFMISIMFIIFDIEISLLIPMIMPINFNHPQMIHMITMIFLLIMWMGLIFEWYESSMKWKI